jgi:adenosylhomocysteinase
MDMSFANQAWPPSSWSETRDAREKVYVVPRSIDREIARLKLASMGIVIDSADPRAAEVHELVGGRDLPSAGPADV